jgi:hypothetical protein
MYNLKSKFAIESHQFLSKDYRLSPSETLEQIDNDRLWFTNKDIETKPHVSVRGLWIFKFVQREY